MRDSKTMFTVNSSDVPQDRFYLVYLSSFFLGMGMLFPWNMFINATTYFDARFCGTSFAGDYLNYIGIAYNMFNLTGFAVTYKYGDSIPQRSRVLVPLTVLAVVFGICTALVFISSISGNLLFILSIVLIMISGFSVAILQAGVFGLMGQLPAIYTQAIMAGQGLGGLIVSVVSLTTTAAGSATLDCDGDDDSSCDEYTTDYSAFAYFLVATVVVVLNIVTFIAVEKHPFILYYTSQSNRETESQNEPLLKQSTDEEGGVVPVDVNPRAIFSKVSGPAFAVYLVFIVTLCVFPSITSKIVSDDKCKKTSRFFNDLFVPFSFLNFNFFDFVGRSAAGYYQLFKADNILLPCVVRILFVPLFMVCNVDGGHVTTLLSADAFPIIIMIVFAFTNGYLGSLCMMYGPHMVKLEEQEWAGVIMAFCLTAGIASGSWLSFAVLAANTFSNPFSG